MMTDTRSAERFSASPAAGSSPGTAVLARRRWAVWLAVAITFVVAYQLAPSAYQQFGYPAFSLLTVGVFAVGIRRNRPARPFAFWMFAVGTSSTALGDVVYMSYESVFGHEVPYPSAADALYISAYAFWAAGIVLLLRGRRTGRDVGGWIDTAIAITAFALVEFVFLIYPYFSSPDTPFLSRFVSAAYPVGDLLLLAVLARLLVSPGSKTMSYRFLVAGFLATFASDAVYGVLALNGDYTGGIIDAGWMASYALFAAAALHPSIRSLATPTPDVEAGLSRRRLLTLTALGLVAPGLFAYTAGDGFAVPPTTAIAIGAGVLFVLVIARMSGLVARLDDSMRDAVASDASRQRLLRSTLRAVEDERARIAHELHDGPIQQLTALSYRFQALSKRSADGASHDVDSLQELLSGQISDLRRMMTSFRPGALEERGLKGALEDHVSSVVGEGIATQVDVHLLGRPSGDIELVLYRVAQQALKNAVRHGNPDVIAISVQEDDGATTLTITDDGDGFDPAVEVDSQQIGLLTMREQVEMVDGAFEVHSAPYLGTTIVAKIPQEVTS